MTHDDAVVSSKSVFMSSSGQRLVEVHESIAFPPRTVYSTTHF